MKSSFLSRPAESHFKSNISTLDFKFSPCSESCIFSFGYFPGVRLSFADVSEYIKRTSIISGFGGLVVSALASGTQVRGFKPGRNRRNFGPKKSSARLPSEGK
jgi:hypothetical protein